LGYCSLRAVFGKLPQIAQITFSTILGMHNVLHKMVWAMYLHSGRFFSQPHRVTLTVTLPWK
jgi:hypothetical protein